jgi:hypothetical protein
METRQGASASQAAAEYYKSIHVNDKSPSFADRFKDIDDAANFEHYQKLLMNADTKNFVLDFGDDDAWCAVNLDQDEFGALSEETVRLLLFVFVFMWLVTDCKHRNQKSLGRDGCKFGFNLLVVCRENDSSDFDSHLWAPETQKESIRVCLFFTHCLTQH